LKEPSAFLEIIISELGFPCKDTIRFPLSQLILELLSITPFILLFFN